MPRVAMLTDTYADINGVATVLHELVEHATTHDWPFTLVSAGPERSSQPGLEVFPAIDSRALDVYPGFPMSLLPILQILRWCEENDIDVIHAATPGPVGLVAWLLANSLDLPLVGTYHTDLPNLGFHLTGDHLLKESLWAYVRVFYDQCAVVFCPSSATRLELIDHRVKSRSSRFPRAWTARCSTRRAATCACGRTSAEASTCCCGWAASRPRRGWTPWRRSTRRCARDGTTCSWSWSEKGRAKSACARLAPEASFLGVKTGEELAAIFASADVFLFPGHAETFGQTVLEAAASGLRRWSAPARAPRTR